MNEVLNQIVILREQVHESCDALCRAAVQGDVGEVQSAMVMLQDKVPVHLPCPILSHGKRKMLRQCKN